jgi:hypothetical protein
MDDRPNLSAGTCTPASLSMAGMSDEATVADRPAGVLRATPPGPLWRWVKIASYVELALFAGLLVVWLLPGLEHETFILGLSHGLGYIALVLLIWVAILRHEAPYTLLAATLTPVGPVGSVIAIEVIERRQGMNERRDPAGAQSVESGSRR